MGVLGIRSLICAANLGAGRTDLLKVAAVDSDLMVGILSRMPTGLAMVREKQEKIAMGFMLKMVFWLTICSN